MSTGVVGKGARVPIVLEQGATFDFNGPLLLTNTVDGSIRTLTGYTAQMQIRTNENASTPLADWSTSNYITINAGAGSLTFAVPYAVVAALGFTTAVYDLFLTYSGVKERVLYGPVTLSKQVTR